MEPRSLEELYRRYAGELYLYAYSLCQNRARAQDLTAEAFCRALLSLEGEGVQWRGWLFKVCRNLWLDELRRGKYLAPEPPRPCAAAGGGGHPGGAHPPGDPPHGVSGGAGPFPGGSGGDHPLLLW